MNKSVTPSSALFSSSHISTWSAPESNPIDKITLSGQCIEELISAAAKSTDENFTETPPEELTHCRAIAEHIQASLACSGAVIIDRLPADSQDVATIRRAAGILSNLISPIMAQDVKGTKLYDVIDEGKKATGTIRRSKTNEEQPFHTDGPWHVTTPKYIGLFCVQPAAQGGYSQVSSLQYNIGQLLNQNPELLSTLVSHMPWNKMGQFNKNENAYSDLPIMQEINGETLIRHYADYVRTGHQLADTELAESVSNFLRDLDESLAANACEPFKLEAGQMQYVNNWTVAHARAGFDDPNAQSGRHLVRLWNTARQS